MIQALLGAVLGAVIGPILAIVVARLPAHLLNSWRIEAIELAGATSEPLLGQNWPATTKALRIIGVRPQLIVMVAALLSCVVIVTLGWTPKGMSMLLLTWGLVVLAFIDAEHQMLPDAVVLPLLWLGLIANYFHLFVSLDEALWGAIIGYLLLWSVFWGFKLLTGRDGMGDGDFKMLAMLGAWGGLSALHLIVLIASVSGAVVGLAVLRIKPSSAGAPIAFGPYLATGGFIAILWGEQFIRAYLRWAL